MNLSDRKIAVTGATGLVGHHVVRALLDRGAGVVAAVRSPARAAPLVALGAEAHEADLFDEDALAAAFAGCEGVVGAAAVVSLGGKSPRDVLRTNVQGTSNVVRACHRAGASHLVLVSSVIAYRPQRDRTYREDDPLREETRVNRWNAYGVSKAAAERAARALADDLGVMLTIVRPAAIHGAFDRGTLSRWMTRFLAPPVSVFPTRLAVPSVYAGDLADVCCRILERPQVAAGRAYNVAGDPDQTFWDLYEAWREAGGHVPRLVVPVPVPLRWRWDITRAQRELGFENRPLVEGFREMIALEQQSA